MRNKFVLLIRKSVTRVALLPPIVLLSINVSLGSDFKGASEVLRLAAETSAITKEKRAEPNAAFREKLKSFQASNTNLAPADAAKQWLALVEQYETESARLTPEMGFRHRGPAASIRRSDERAPSSIRVGGVTKSN